MVNDGGFFTSVEFLKMYLAALEREYKQQLELSYKFFLSLKIDNLKEQIKEYETKNHLGGI